MTIKRIEIARILEGIADRLDEVVDIVSILDVGDHSAYETEDYDDYLDDNSEQIESTEILSENRIDEISDILTREIDSIRKLADIIEI